MYDAVARWLQSNSDTYPATSGRTQRERSLGKWVEKQAAMFRADRFTQGAGQRELLNALPGWEARADRGELWDSRCDQVVAFWGDNRRWPSKATATQNEKTLGIWLDHQKEVYSGLRPGITRHKAQRLESLHKISPLWSDGGRWNQPSWDFMFATLQKEWARKDGLPKDSEETLTKEHGYVNLGEWLAQEVHWIDTHRWRRLKRKTPHSVAAPASLSLVSSRAEKIRNLLLTKGLGGKSVTELLQDINDSSAVAAFGK